MKPSLTIYLTVCLKILVANDLAPCHIVSFTEITFRQCSDECLRRPACKSITYIRGATVCALHGTIGTACRYVSSWKRKQLPGVVSLNVTAQWQHNEWHPCHNLMCDRRQVCNKEDGSCKISECPVPPLIPKTHRNGNLRHFGSKVKYSCKNHSAPLMYSECKPTGTWTGVHMTCEIPG